MRARMMAEIFRIDCFSHEIISKICGIIVHPHLNRQQCSGTLPHPKEPGSAYPSVRLARTSAKVSFTSKGGS